MNLLLFVDSEFDFDCSVDFDFDQVVGGIDMMQQACKLATRPHIVVSTGECERTFFVLVGVMGLWFGDVPNF